MPPILETARLRLREFTRRDLDALAEMVADEDQMTFYPRPKTRDEASAWIDHNIALYADRGFGFWLLESVHDEAFLGYCGIRPLMLEGVPQIELGWHTKKTSWNRGIATEAALAAVRLAFQRFSVSRLIAVIHPDHTASRRVAQKLGMSLERATVIDDYPANIYAIERTGGSVPGVPP
jgi:RimJ/RimL family protein N-acetyltransferase